MRSGMKVSLGDNTRQTNKKANPKKRPFTKFLDSSSEHSTMSSIYELPLTRRNSTCASLLKSVPLSTERERALHGDTALCHVDYSQNQDNSEKINLTTQHRSAVASTLFIDSLKLDLPISTIKQRSITKLKE